MSREIHPMGACLDHLRELVQTGASGNFYLAADNNIGAITLNSGTIVSVNFQGRRGDLAVELLKTVEMASCSFRAEPARGTKHSQLSNYAIRWLTGGASNPAPVASIATATRSATDRAEIEQHRKTIESITFRFLGPIAGAVCESAFADCGTLRQVIDDLAGNLPPSEAGQFRAQIAKATGVR
jgi:hypothetical protein